MNGTGFVGITSVRFNGIASTNFTVDSEQKIRAIVPAGATTGKLKLTVKGGVSNSEDSFSVLIPPAPPVLDAFTPASGPVGTEVTIKGSGFSGATAVTFNGAPASSFTIDSGAQIRAVVPAGATSGKLVVTTSVGSATSAASFTVTTSTVPPTPSTPTTYRVYVGLIAGGSAAAKHIYTAQTTTSWSGSANARGYICELEGR